MSVKTEKVLNVVVKVAGAAVTVPATVAVAGGLFADVPSGWRWLVQVAAVLLVEGVFLSNWLLLETSKTKDTAYKVRYALTALGLYAGLWVLAWSHGEGLAGLVFRLALGAALGGSVYDAGVYDLLRAARRADGDVRNTRAVKRLSRKLARGDAQLQLRLDSEYSQALSQAEHAARMEGVNLYSKRLLQGVRAEDAELGLVPESPSQTGNSNGRGSNLDRGRKRANARKRDSKADRLERMVDLLRDNPRASLRELGEGVGVSHTTADRYLKELQEQGKVASANGDGYRVLV